MKTNFLMDFTVDKDNSTVNVKREFGAPIANVWAAWTEPEILDKWWAPAQGPKVWNLKKEAEDCMQWLVLKEKSIGQ